MTTVDDRLDYDEGNRAPRVRIHQPRDISHVELRGNYFSYERRQDNSLESLGLLINGPLIWVRGEELSRILVKEYKKAIEKYKESGSLDAAARLCPYLKDDFKVSPEVARNIFLYALRKSGNNDNENNNNGKTKKKREKNSKVQLKTKNKQDKSSLK